MNSTGFRIGIKCREIDCGDCLLRYVRPSDGLFEQSLQRKQEGGGLTPLLLERKRIYNSYELKEWGANEKCK